jgi:hypothetical protein
MKADKVESCFRKRLAWKAKTFANPIYDERLRGQLPHCRGSDVVRHSALPLPGGRPGPRRQPLGTRLAVGTALAPRLGAGGRAVAKRSEPMSDALSLRSPGLSSG